MNRSSNSSNRMIMMEYGRERDKYNMMNREYLRMECRMEEIRNEEWKLEGERIGRIE